MTATYDIGVLGSGPAALSIAAACSRRGASVALVAPEPESLWLPNYCLWADEVPPEMEGLAEHIWPDVCVATPLGTRKLNRPYVKLNTLELQTFLWNAFRSGTAHVIPRRASHLDHRVGETRIHVEDGSTHRARLVVDASGATTRFVRRVHRRAPAFQTAYGLMLRAPDHGFDPGQMTLMDFRPASTHATEPPSFLYALPLSGGRLFLEETSLARRPAVRLEVLRARLQVRLESLGLEHAERIGEELCSIPMGLGLPAHGQPLVPFGAAASMVHPASGYLISRICRTCRRVDSRGPRLGWGRCCGCIRKRNAVAPVSANGLGAVRVRTRGFGRHERDRDYAFLRFVLPASLRRVVGIPRWHARPFRARRRHDTPFS
jgi:lycopene beta-cyclase